MKMKTVLTRLKIKIKIESKIKKKICNTFEKRSWNYVLNKSSQRVDIPYEKHINKCKKFKRHFSVVADSFLIYLPKIILNPTPTNPVGSFT